MGIFKKKKHAMTFCMLFALLVVVQYLYGVNFLSYGRWGQSGWGQRKGILKGEIGNFNERMGNVLFFTIIEVFYWENRQYKKLVNFISNALRKTLLEFNDERDFYGKGDFIWGTGI